MRLTIPEFDTFNGSYMDSLKATLCLISYQALRLNEKYPNSAIDDLTGYRVAILLKILRCFHSFIKVVDEVKDYITGASILRIIADNLASFILIYHDGNEEQMKLRHFLFILDGLNSRLKGFNRHEIIKTEYITDTEFQALKKQIEDSIDNTKEGMNFCLERIHSMPLYRQHKKSIDTLIAQGYNWKFKNIDSPKNNLSWQKMYEMIDTKKSMTDMLSFFSQYVHGLSISNLTIDTSDETFEPLIGFAIALLGKVNTIINNDFGVYKLLLLKGFMQSDYGTEYLSYYSTSKLNEFINILNQSTNRKQE